MKKILLGLVAAFALTTLAAPAFSGDEAPAGDAKGDAAAKKGKKGKKGKKAEGEAGGDAAPAGDAAKK